MIKRTWVIKLILETALVARHRLEIRYIADLERQSRDKQHLARNDIIEISLSIHTTNA